MKNLFIHLTNSSVHKKKDDYMNDEDEMDEEHGPKRLMSRVLEQLYEAGYDPDEIKEQIFDVVTKTIISLIPYLSDFARIAINPNIEHLRCF
jgi:predicted transcriptional regulator